MNNTDDLLEGIELVDFSADFDFGVYEVECKIDDKSVTFTAFFDNFFNLQKFSCEPNESELIEQYRDKIFEFIRRLVLKQCWRRLREQEQSVIFECSNWTKENQFAFDALIVNLERSSTKRYCVILDKLMSNYYTKGTMTLIRRIKDHAIKGKVDFIVKTEDIIDASKVHEGIAKEKTNPGAGVFVWDVENIKLKRI